MIVLKNIYKLFNFQLIGLHRLTILLFVLIVSPNILAVDTDGDGIDDAIDLDSDNDGILNRDEGVICTYPNVSRSAGHNVVDGTESYGSGCTSGLGGTSQWSNGFYSENDKNKTFYAYWNISVKPGVPFTITATVSSVNAHWKNNGVSSGTFRILNQPNSSLVVTNYGNNFSGITRTETFIPTSNNVRVQFDFKMKRTNFNCAGYNLPEISLRFSFKKQVWTTCSSYDFDQDGIPNYLDLDSDNDGISDLIESGADYVALDPDNNGVIDGTQFVDNDNDGLADVIESTNGDNKGIKVIETDGDGNANFLDFDSDGDGIPDAIESQLTATYVVNYSNDGDVTDDDGDGDGVLDVYDGVSGHGGDFNSPQNTDGTDNPDYLDLDSDNDSKADILEGGNIVKNVKYEDPDGSINNPMIDLPNETGDNKEVAYREVCIKPTLTITSPHCMSDGTSKFTALPGGGTWSGPGVSADGVFDPNSAGSGTHTISYSLGGTCVENVNIVVNDAPSILSTTDVDPTCVNSSGSTTINASGGTAPLEYSIDNGVSYQASNFFGGLSVGTYDVVVRDANLCTDNSSVTVNPENSPKIDNVSRVDETCAALGSLTLTASGGIPPLTYSLDEGATFFSTNNFNQLSAGNYNVMVMDAIGCMDNRPVTIDPPANIVIDSVVVIDDSCSACQGEATIYASGPSPFNYSIDNNATSQASNVFTNLCSGALNIVVSTGSCSTNGNGTVANLGTVADATITDPGTVCVTQGDIALSAATPGGVWSGTGVNPVTGVFNTQSSGPGSFTLTYTLGGACGNTDNITLTVTDTVDPGIDPVSAQCELGSPVSLTATESGGVWSGVGVSGNQFDPVDAGAGTHTIYYTLTGVCSEVDSTEITVENKIDPNISPVNPLCITQSPVNLTTAVSGGIWSGSVVSASGLFDPSTSGAGTHTVYYTIPGTCTNNDSINIAVVDTTRPAIDPVSPLCVTSGLLSLAGSTPGGTWSGIGVNGNQFDPQTAGPGTHYVLYTIAGTCTDTAGMSISVTDTLNPGINPVDPVCVIGSPVSLTANIGGGTWSGNGVSDHHATFNPQTAGAGTHKVYYTVTGICVDRDSINIAVSDTITPAIDPVSTQCTGNAAFQLTSSIPGGTWSGTGVNPVTGVFNTQSSGPGSFTLTYTLGGACGNTDNITLTVTDTVDPGIDPVSAQCELGSPVSLTATESGGVWSGVGVSGNQFDPVDAGAGTHTIYYTLTGVCSEVDSTEITVENKIDPNISPVNPLCITQSPVNLTTAVSGGIWSGSVVSASGLFDPSTSGAGTHTVYYTIPGTCTNNDSINIAVVDTTRPAIDPVSPLCVTSGLLSLAGSTPGGTWSGIGVNGNQFDPQTAGPGTHYVLYTIAGTCTDTAGMSISVTDTLNPGINPVDPVCVIGSPVSLTANIGGGTWSGNGVSDHHATFNPQTAGAGTHKVYYTVTGICVDRDSINIAVSDTITPAIDPVSTQCTGNAAFQLTSSIPGGTWSGNGITHASNGTFDPAIAQAGTHTITYTINIGACNSSPSIEIDVFDSQDATIAPAGPFCSIDSPTLLTAVDGAGIWSGSGINASTGSFDPATAGSGTHEIIYTIAGVCGDADTIMVEVIQQPDVSITTPPILCVEGDPVQLTAATSGGIWSGSGVDSTGVFTPVVTGNFVITYSIPGFCGNFDQITVVVEENPIIEVNSTINNTCSGAEVSLSYISTVPLSNCSWDFGDGTTVASCEDVTYAYTQVGCYDVIISGDSPAGCRAKKEAADLVCIHPDPVAAFESDKETVKTSYPKISFTNLSENAITYVWDFAGEGSSTMEHPSYTFPPEAGVYNVCLEATSQYGCTDVVCHEVYVEEDQLISVPNAFTPNGDGLNDTFVPIIIGYGETPAYQMQIWNRWGELVFETDNLKEYWDGRANGDDPMNKTYVWKMYIYDSEGNPHDYIGHVSVLK